MSALIAALGLCGALASPAFAFEDDDAPSPGPPPKASGTKSGTKKAHKPSAKKARKAKAAPETKAPRAKPTRLAKKSTSTINEDVRLTPFPSHPDAARKALAQNRRDQLDDAEKAARSPTQADRWQTVLFHLRDLDARADSEGCFWRLVAYYRLGQVERARTLRQSCDLVPKDAALIEAEDEQAASLQSPRTVADKEEPPSSVGNPAPYTGASPARIDH